MKPEAEESNALYDGLTKLGDKARTGQFITTRGFVILAGVVFVIAALCYWWYATGVLQKANALTWNELDTVAGPNSLADFVKEHTNDHFGRVARLQEARVWLGPDGVAKLTNFADRPKAVESIEKARAAFLKLADEFKDDLTLHCQCLDAAAHAELSLVGIPKDGKVDDYRGTVDAAADLFKKLAAAAGEATPVGEKAKKKAEELTANKDKVLQTAQALNNKFPSLKQSPEFKLPKLDDLKAPAPTAPPAGNKEPAPPPVPTKK